jgi:high-affinity nickel permease
VQCSRGMSFFDAMDGCFKSVGSGWAFTPGPYSLVITGLPIAGQDGDLSRDRREDLGL